MPKANHPRFHFDPHRAKGSVPGLDVISTWCMHRLMGEEGRRARDAIGEAGRVAGGEFGRGVAVKTVSGLSAEAIRRASREIHAVAMEHGYDPTAYEPVSNGCAKLCILRVVEALTPQMKKAQQDDMAQERADELLHAIKVTSEAYAFGSLMFSMIERGRFDKNLMSMLRSEVLPETVVIIDGVLEVHGRD